MAHPFDIDELRQRLMSARSAERFVPFVEHAEPGWAPAPCCCHSNVDWWAARHEDFIPVRGWLVFDFSRASTELIDVVRFTAHSVLQGPDEALIDITPTRAKARYPFVLHPGTPDEFGKIVEILGLAYIDCHRSMS